MFLSALDYSVATKKATFLGRTGKVHLNLLVSIIVYKLSAALKSEI